MVQDEAQGAEAEKSELELVVGEAGQMVRQ
jgi:hypothetical protein